MTATIVLPGIGGSGAAHWQSLWEARQPDMMRHMMRLRPASWDAPDRDDWLAALDRCIAAAEAPALLVAHSLGCLLVAHWAASRPHDTARVRGAFLVAVPDPEGTAFPHAEAASFKEVPTLKLPFASLIVASTDDPYASLAYARSRADIWGTGLAVAGALGHINAASGLGDWPQGALLLEAFRAGTRLPA